MSSLNSSCIAKNRHALYLLLEGDVPLVEGKFPGVGGVVVEDRVDLHALGGPPPPRGVRRAAAAD